MPGSLAEFALEHEFDDHHYFKTAWMRDIIASIVRVSLPSFTVASHLVVDDQPGAVGPRLSTRIFAPRYNCHPNNPSTSLQNVLNTLLSPQHSLHPRYPNSLSLPTPTREPGRPHQTGHLMTPPHPTWTYDTTHSHVLDIWHAPIYPLHSFLSRSF